MAKEISGITKKINLSPEKAAAMLYELDTSTPFYYTREKRCDPFEELLDRNGDSGGGRRKFWARKP